MVFYDFAFKRTFKEIFHFLAFKYNDRNNRTLRNVLQIKIECVNSEKLMC